MAENNYQDQVFVNFLIGEELLVFTGTNEIAFLRRGSILFRQKLEPRIMAVLQVLMDGNGQVVMREKIIEKVWGDYRGGEDGLLQAISKLRRIFQDNAKSPKIIETIPKKGYRLLLDVKPTSLKFLNLKKNTQLIGEGAGELASGPIIIQQPGVFTGFIERLTKPKFLLAFLVFSAVLIMILGILSYIIFWAAVLM